MEKCVRRGNPQRQSYWEQVVRRWEQGDQSVREYCRAEGLRESALMKPAPDDSSRSDG
jgi:hypothetical protein